MARSQAFEDHTERYERWFDRHPTAYVSELLALRALLPWEGEGLEIGVGSGRFARPLGVRWGVDPSAAMLRVVAGHGVDAVRGVAEALPFPAARFDFVLMVTTVCFVDDIRLSCAEMFRVLKPGGAAVLGFVDRASPLGQVYLQGQAANPFYRDATFYAAQELIDHLVGAGFSEPTTVQTLFTPLDAMTAVQPVRSGHGEGGFVALRATRPPDRPIA